MAHDKSEEALNAVSAADTAERKLVQLGVLTLEQASEHLDVRHQEIVAWHLLQSRKERLEGLARLAAFPED